MRRLKKISFLIISTAAIAAVSIISAGCITGIRPAEKTKTVHQAQWIANSNWPSENHQSAGLAEFAGRASRMTGGSVEITVQAGGTLGYKDPDLLKAVKDGLIPVSDMMASGVAGAEPLFNIVTLPFLVRSFDEGRILNDITSPYFAKIVEQEWGQKILYVSPWPASGIWSKKEIREMADLIGLKTRTYDNNGDLVMNEVGATPYRLAFNEIYSSITSGLIDSVMTSTPTAADTKLWEVLDYYAPLNIIMATDLVTVNLKEFNKLDKETQGILVGLGKDMEKEMWDKVAALDKEKESICSKNGIEIIVPGDRFLNELSAVTKNIRDSWLKTAPPEARAIIDEFDKKTGRQG